MNAQVAAPAHAKKQGSDPGRLRAAVQDGRASQDACFRLLYRLTTMAQIDGAKRMARRYVPVFSRRWPEISRA